MIPVVKLRDCIDSHEIAGFGVKSLDALSLDGEIIRPPHRHECYYVLFVEAGSGTHTIDFREYVVQRNSVFFLTPGQVHALRIDRHSRGYILFFKPDFYLLNGDPKRMLAFPFFHSLSNDPVLYLNSIEESIGSVMNEIFAEYQQADVGRDQVIRAYLDVLFVRLARAYAPRHVLPSVRLTQQLRELETLIDAHYREYKALDDYADLLHVSVQHLSDIVRQGLDKSGLQLIHERVLVEARRLLLYTDLTVSQITYELGFSDKSHFIRLFKKYSQTTPEQYRITTRAEELALW
jgi:AraC family transcriptional regulator, transcriptional activator of pobA